MSEDLVALAADAYIYGYPLVYDIISVQQIAGGGLGSLQPEPFNAFAHATALAGPETKFVSVNNDTLYSIAQLDMSGGPLRLDVPDTAGRYYVLQFVDAWTNNFAYVGKRATGTEAGSYVLVPPGWTGAIPDHLTRIDVPTMVATIVGRIACAGTDDLPNVAELQRGLRLTPLQPDAPVGGIPEPDPTVPRDLAFFERVRVWMAAFPPSANDHEYARRFEALGLLAVGGSPYSDVEIGTDAGMDAEAGLAKELIAGASRAKRRIEDALADRSGLVNGWSSTTHLFDYNTDRLGLGTLDEAAWKTKDPEARLLTRAIAARTGLWGNHGYEAAYPMANVDGDGDQLNGGYAYTLRFEKPPPVAAFWSLTMYDTPEYFLVANPINRYSIGDRTPGLGYGDRGELVIVMQHDEPADPAAKANWLPTPPGDFRPILRMYAPQPEVLDGSYRLPPIAKAERS